jgi:maltodextrin utilization protein YvdJ
MIEANDPRKTFVSWQTIFLIIFFNAIMIGICVYMIHAGSYFVIFYVLYIKQKIKKIFSFDKKYIGRKHFSNFDFETLLIFMLIFLKGTSLLNSLLLLVIL